jgi:hypothetical protein
MTRLTASRTRRPRASKFQGLALTDSLASASNGQVPRVQRLSQRGSLRAPLLGAMDRYDRSSCGRFALVVAASMLPCFGGDRTLGIADGAAGLDTLTAVCSTPAVIDTRA